MGFHRGFVGISCGFSWWFAMKWGNMCQWSVRWKSEGMWDKWDIVVETSFCQWVLPQSSGGVQLVMGVPNSWLVYNGKPIPKWMMIWGYPHDLGNHQMVIYPYGGLMITRLSHRGGKPRQEDVKPNHMSVSTNMSCSHDITQGLGLMSNSSRLDFWKNITATHIFL